MRVKQIRRKENFMDKTINEKLFEQLMRAPKQKNLLKNKYTDQSYR